MAGTVKEEAQKLRQNLDKVYTAGQQAEYDRFWDAYLQNGNISGSYYLFTGMGWTEDTLYPKYNVFDGLKIHYYSFFECEFAGDLAERFTSLGLGDTMAFGSSPMQAFRSMNKVTRLPILGVSKATSLNYLFTECLKLETIDKLIISNDGATTFNSTFNNCPMLQNIRFEGVIGKDISFSNSSHLTEESVQDIIDHLKDLTGQTAQKVTFHTDVLLKLTEEQMLAITAKNWTM